MSTSHCPGEPRRLVLASASPRRRDLLRTLGIEFEADASSAPEDIEPGAAINDVVLQLAERKALDVALRHRDALIIAADTLVSLDGVIFSKPRDEDDAIAMLRRMSGKTHRVASGLVLLDTATMSLDRRIVETDVRFRPIDDAEIDAYVATGEPLDKAGAYGAQGLGAAFIEGIVGDYWNVVGLPLAALHDLLRASGYCLICRKTTALRDE